MICQSNRMEDYLEEDEQINYTHPLVRSKAKEVLREAKSNVEAVKTAYTYVRDSIGHTWDLGGSQITRSASEVLTYCTGLCYAKSYLLAALLRLRGIPVGLCYQRLTLTDTPDSHILHGLVAVYLGEYGRWIRLDARGNKPGVDARFSLEGERLAFPIRPQYGEVDYPLIYTSAHPIVLEAYAGVSDMDELIARLTKRNSIPN